MTKSRHVIALVLGIALTSAPAALAQQTAGATTAGQSVSDKKGSTSDVNDLGYKIVKCSDAAGRYTFSYRESGNYQHIQHGRTVDLSNNGRFSLLVTVSNTSDRDKDEAVRFVGNWLEYEHPHRRTILLAYDPQVDGAAWTAESMARQAKIATNYNLAAERLANDELKFRGEILRRNSNGGPSCSPSPAAIPILVARLQNEKAWQAVKKGYVGDLGVNLTLALSANEVFRGTNYDVLDTIAAIYALQGNFSEAAAYQQKALAAVEAQLANQGTNTKKSMLERLALYGAGRPYVENK